MQGFIDIFSKLIIAIISFIAPVIVYLLSVFSEGIILVTKIADEEREQIEGLLADGLASKKKNISKLLTQSNNDLKKSEKHNKIKINLLTPKRQINRIFSRLFASLIFIMLAAILKDSNVSLCSIRLSILMILASVCLFFCGVIVLKQVAWMIIETKQELAKNKIDKGDGSIKPIEIPQRSVDQNT